MSRQRHRRILERPAKKDLPGFRLTQRDLEIIKAVYRYRAMTTDQIELLIFPTENPEAKYGLRSKCRERLAKLFHHGYLWRGDLATTLNEGKKPLVYRIDKKALDWLPQLLGLELDEIDWTPNERTVSDLYLNHLLRINDVRAVLEAGAEAQGLRIKQWLDERDLKRTHANDKVTITDAGGNYKPATVIPDGYLAIYDKQTKQTAHFFIEVDLQTEIGRTTNPNYRDWVRKIKAYLAYYHSGLFRQRYKATKFRVLIITTSARRLENLKQKTEAAGGKRIFWFSTLDQVTLGMVYTAPIWRVASLGEPVSWKI